MMIEVMFILNIIILMRMLYCYFNHKRKVSHYKKIWNKYLMMTPWERAIEYDLICADRAEEVIVKYLFDVFKVSIVSLVVVCLVKPIGDLLSSIINRVVVDLIPDTCIVGGLVFLLFLQCGMSFKYEYELKYIILVRLIKEYDN